MERGVNRSRLQSGFTLVEMSIVIMIIGLITGSIFVGRDLIEAAKLRNTVAEFEKLVEGSNAFLAKYRYKPGDVPSTKAAAWGLAPNPGAGMIGLWGNGDGKIGGVGNFSNPSHVEVPQFTYHLAIANLIPQEGLPNTTLGRIGWQSAAFINQLDDFAGRYVLRNDYSTAEIGGIFYTDTFPWGTFPSPGGGAPGWGKDHFGVVLGINPGSATDLGSPHNDYNWLKTLTAQQAFYIDAKLDDGTPSRSGKVANWRPPYGHAGAKDCTDDPTDIGNPTSYNFVAGEQRVCAIWLRIF